MSDTDSLSPIYDAPFWEFDNAWYHIDDARLLEEFDQEWDEIACQIAAEAGVFTQEYGQQYAPLEDSGEVPILANPEQSALMSGNRDRHRALDIAFLEDMMEFMEHEGLTDIIGLPFSPSQVENFLEDSPRIEIKTLEKDDQECSICKSKYGKERRDTTKSASNSEQGLLDEEMPEYPVKLPCDHVFGDGCIKTWLLGQSASCPLCRLQFAGSIDKKLPTGL